jgi:hypothetical protein
VTEYTLNSQISYETESESEPKLEQKIETTAEPFFFMQILRDFFNLKDQIKKE